MTGTGPATPEMTDAGLRAGRARAGVSRRAVYQVTITAKGGGPVSAAVCRWLGLPEDWPAAERHFRAAGNASLRRHLDRFRHPGLDVSYRVTGSDGAPAGSAVRAVRCTDRWLRHDVDGRDLFVYEKPSGKNRFQVYERGAGRRGTARKRAGVASLPEALRLACTSYWDTRPGEETSKLPPMDADQRAGLDYARRVFGIGGRQGEEN